MNTLLRQTIVILALCWVSVANAAENIINVFTWAEEIPRHIIARFEKETGIKVNYTTFDNNEAMYAKLRASKHVGYDIIEPSSYYIDRMRRQNLLEKLDKSKLPNFKNLDPFFIHQAYDPNSEYSIPFVWGITGMFVNKEYFAPQSVKKWSDLLDKKFANQLMFLDDAREVFSMALSSLSYSINDSNPEHIKEAYQKLQTFMPNVRLFNSDAVASILIDEDAVIGMSWNGDLYRASLENDKLAFVYPKEGFEIWVDNFAMLKSAPHKENAYKFLNFLMRPDIAKEVSMNIHYSTANLEARKLLPDHIRNNATLYPSHDILHRGQFETDVGEKTIALYEKYWERLKIGG